MRRQHKNKYSFSCSRCETHFSSAFKLSYHQQHECKSAKGGKESGNAKGAGKEKKGKDAEKGCNENDDAKAVASPEVVMVRTSLDCC